MTDPHLDPFRKGAADAASTGREVQDQIDAIENDGGEEEGPKAMQAGARPYPVPPLPQQHLRKPGREADLELEPMFDAPFYRGSGKLEGFAALITGGDSGIGRAVAVLFAREGCDIAIAYLNEDQDAEATKAAVEREGRRAILLPGDVADPAFATHAVSKTLEAFGRLDVLVHNAAFQEHSDDLTQITDSHFDLTLKTNLYGGFYLARAAVPHMKPGASILMTGSVVGLQGSGGLLDYGMTKGGLHAFARSLSSQLISKGIRVNVVAPGPVWTPLNPADRPDVTEFGAGVPMGRPAQPEEIAPAFVFLASPQMSSYITGEILPVIGGY
ncbi:MAG: SDR family oxidoreductase [Phenylobacterium sp.]|uniref:SDR family oxidoreductase n=1 Tax=Phenylobacterium sp. TaxID=1871053 RepID=UPI0027286DBF|nr:SDR family oxidoreductase [Phenylobacterium sp.]MDO8900655.1 SDR family oxidoreductase [Phenylobacterium sp.]